MINWDDQHWLKRLRAAQDNPELLKEVFDNTKKIVFNQEFRLQDGKSVRLPKLSFSRFFSDKIALKSCENKSCETSIILSDKDCLNIAFGMLKQNLIPAILILGSIKQPGGGVKKGCKPQEEDIYRRTNLFQEMFKYGNFKEVKSSRSFQYPLNENFGLVFVGKATVFRGTLNEGYKLLDNPFQTNFISVSALSNPSGRPLSPTQLNTLRNKIHNVFNAALRYKCDSLILGALGCDESYTNPPKQVAKIFHEVSKEYEGRFKRIVFSIPKNQLCLNQNVYQIFEKEFEDDLTSYVEDSKPVQEVIEGKLINAHYGRYERSKLARDICLAHYGHVCQVCGTDFIDKYGEELGKRVIEVHHKDPIHGFHGNAHKVDPIKDLIPICSNCHSMLHISDPPLSIKELKEKLGFCE